MKKELIKTDNYLLVVDDSAINFDDWVYNKWGSLFQYGIEHRLHPSTKKVIAHLPFGMYSTLEGVPLLPPLEQEDKELYYQKQVMQPYPVESQSYTSYENGFIDGYNKAKEKYKFTEEDMLIIRNQLVTILPTRDISAWWDMIQSISKYTKWLDEYVESLSQPKTPTHFEFEIERKSVLNLGIEPFNPNTHVYTNEPKTTTNSQGQVIACGKYIYEL